MAAPSANSKPLSVMISTTTVVRTPRSRTYVAGEIVVDTDLLQSFGGNLRIYDLNDMLGVTQNNVPNTVVAYFTPGP